LTSEVQLKAELDIPWGVRTRDLPSRTRENRRTRAVEVGRVEDIEKLESQLEAQPFSELVLLDKGEIPLMESRPRQDVLPGIPKTWSKAALSAVVLKQFVLNHSATVWGPAPLHTRSGR